MDKLNAIFITNGGYDAVILRNRTYVIVHEEVFRHFLDAESNGDDFSDWEGDNWPDIPVDDAYTLEDEMWTVAEEMGNIVAFYMGDTLHIRDDEEWERRKEFWGVE